MHEDFSAGRSSSSKTASGGSIPHPYCAMLAICSDLDETPDGDAYYQLMRFLNTTEMTPHGQGVGLEVGNSIYFDMPPGQFSYWNTDDAGRAMVRALMQSGHIDCLHSFGDLATTRAQAGRALEELVRHNCRLRVWVDHAVAPTNFGADIMRGHGDEPGHPAYHSDLTCAYGIRYVWRGRVTSTIGQGKPPSLRHIGMWQHPVASMVTLLKEAVKQGVGACGSDKFHMHWRNAPLTAAKLRDGRAVCEFLRCNPHWGGVSSADTARGIGDVLTIRFLDRLVERRGVCILYTHLGKTNRKSGCLLNKNAIMGFRRLAEYFNNGKILVTTTSRLLEYCDRSTRQDISPVPWSALVFPNL
jgi:hypothetical protein